MLTITSACCGTVAHFSSLLSGKCIRGSQSLIRLFTVIFHFIRECLFRRELLRRLFRGERLIINDRLIIIIFNVQWACFIVGDGWAVLVTTQESLASMFTAALEEVTLPLVMSEGPVFTLGSGQTSLAWIKIFSYLHFTHEYIAK